MQHSPGLFPFPENLKLFFSRKYGQNLGCGLYTSVAYTRVNKLVGYKYANEEYLYLDTKLLKTYHCY